MNFYPRQNQRIFDNFPDNQQQYYRQNNYNSGQRPMVGSALPGKYIQSIRDIRPGDVPGDGSVGWFPAEDYSCVIARGWSQEGDRMDTVKYVPEIQKPETPQQSEESIMLQNLLTKVQRMEEMLLASGLFETNTQNETKQPVTQENIEGGNEA